MIAFLSYIFNLPLKEIRRWTIKEITENYCTQIIMRKKIKELKEDE